MIKRRLFNLKKLVEGNIVSAVLMALPNVCNAHIKAYALQEEKRAKELERQRFLEGIL